MSLSIIGRRYGASVNESGTAGRVEDKTYTVEYLIRSTDCSGDEASVLDTEGLPKLGSQSPIYPDMYVNARTATEGEGDGLWTVSITYSIITGTSDGDNPVNPDSAPWEVPVRASYSTRRKPSLKSKMIFLGAFQNEVGFDTFEPTTFSWNRALIGDAFYLDEDKNQMIPVTNSAGENIYYDGERILRVAELSFAATIYETEKWLARVNSVNRNNVFVSELYPNVPPGKALLDEFRAERKIHVYASGFREVYYECSASVVIDPLGHWVEFADIGTLYFEGGLRTDTQRLADASTFINSDGEPTTSELNGRGGARASYENTWFVKYVPYRVVEW